MKKFVAVGEMVVVSFEKSKKLNKKTKSGIVLLDQDNEPDKYDAVVESIGSGVKDPEFKVGDIVLFNEIDMKKFIEPNPDDAANPFVKGITRAVSIWGVMK
jgi:co-chaperonin GroES (HSP10)